MHRLSAVHDAACGVGIRVHLEKRLATSTSGAFSFPHNAIRRGMLYSTPMAGTTAFGTSVSPKIASAIMDAASLNQSPSPSEPSKVPADGLVKQYGVLYGVASKLLHEETNDGRKMELQRIVTFCDRALNEAAEAMSQAGAPVPDVATPPPPPPQPMAPMGGAAGPAAPGAGPPGPPPGPPSPGAAG